ncbi:hypothetical protein [Candidatus Mycobacterium methanotrophicum]|uniref:Amino acid permease/ SLC12A domain-containing protein n=1 Tax=Candidatus Mycobacterium methanotrophicum TaxID=2943498 RepID=A0ABY4QTY6_9MYCO|nr:hypothetical protein [Candidatus Mycobacterium methanotrophicum]UQX13590.1 hypothetical protein M5I08_25730 [Candidatus Mycobacterium methanotrophicum]
MMLTILVGGVSASMSYIGYVLAAPNLQDIVNGNDPDPIPSILESSLGHIGSKLFLCIAITAFISCVLSLQAAVSRLLYDAFGRDRMLPGSAWLSKMTEHQAVVLAALRQRICGWRRAGDWNLGNWGMIVNVLALCYAVFAMILLLKPVDTGSFLDKWIVAIGLIVVLSSGLIYMLLARAYRHSDDIGEGDAIKVAHKLSAMKSTAPKAAYPTTRDNPGEVDV